MAVGKPVIQGLDKALSTNKEAQVLEYTKLAETTTKTASEAKKVEDAKKVLDVAKVVTEKYPYRDWETDRKSTRLNSSHITRTRMPSSA